MSDYDDLIATQVYADALAGAAVGPTSWVPAATTYSGSTLTVTPSQTAFGAGPEYTVSLWIKPSTVSSRQVVFEAGGYPHGLSIEIDAGVIYASGVRSNVATHASAAIATGSWRHIVAVWSANLVSLYLDGVLAASTAVTGTFGAGGDAGAVGGSNAIRGYDNTELAANTNYMAADAADLRVWDDPLSAADVAVLFAGPVASSYASLLSNATAAYLTPYETDTADNYASSSHDGSWVGTSGYVAGRYGTASSHAAGGYISVPAHADLRPASVDWTIAGSFRATASDSAGTIVSSGSPFSTRPNFSIQRSAAGTFDVFVADGTTSVDGTRLVFRAASAVADTNWHDFAAVFNRNTDELLVWLDGVLVDVIIGTATTDGGDLTGISPNYPHSLHIGASSNGSAATDLQVESLSIHGDALSAADLAVLFAGPASGSLLRRRRMANVN